MIATSPSFDSGSLPNPNSSRHCHCCESSSLESTAGSSDMNCLKHKLFASRMSNRVGHGQRLCPRISSGCQAYWKMAKSIFSDDWDEDYAAPQVRSCWSQHKLERLQGCANSNAAKLHAAKSNFSDSATADDEEEDDDDEATDVGGDYADEYSSFDMDSLCLCNKALKQKRAPDQLVMHFLDRLMREDYKSANRLCKLILIYDPNHKEAQEFEALIEGKLKDERNALFSDSSSSDVEHADGNSDGFGDSIDESSSSAAEDDNDSFESDADSQRGYHNSSDEREALEVF